MSMPDQTCLVVRQFAPWSDQTVWRWTYRTRAFIYEHGHCPPPLTTLTLWQWGDGWMKERRIYATRGVIDVGDIHYYIHHAWLTQIHGGWTYAYPPNKWMDGNRGVDDTYIHGIRGDEWYIHSWSRVVGMCSNLKDIKNGWTAIIEGLECTVRVWVLTKEGEEKL